MQTKLQETTLGRPAFDYLSRILERPRELCRSLKRTLDLNSGRITTCLPPGVPREAIDQFEVGGKLPQPTERTPVSGGYTVRLPTLDDELVARIQAYLGTEASAFCVFENARLRPNYPAANRLQGLRTVMCGDTVCHFLDASDKNVTDLIQRTVRLLRSAGPPYLLGCAGRLSPETHLEEGAIEGKDLDRLTKSTQQLFVGAYDGEGFLTWHR